jgi:hypothetical protein
VSGPEKGKWQVHFVVGADDSYYHASVWVHGLNEEAAKTIVLMANMLGDLRKIQFDSATMEEDTDAGQDDSWETWHRQDGKVIRWKGNSFHLYAD